VTPSRSLIRRPPAEAIFVVYTIVDRKKEDLEQAKDD
jgi:hypothetical protein